MSDDTVNGDPGDGGTIDYGRMMHDAMRGLIREVLQGISDGGLPGDHHFFISFDTTHPDVAIADWLRERYPEEMTIVLQHWFEGLDVREDGFSVTLNFGDAPEPLSIPFDALLTFVDPSVEFGLRFESRHPDGDEAPLEAGTPTTHDAPPPASSGGAEVVSLDRFRK